MAISLSVTSFIRGDRFESVMTGYGDRSSVVALSSDGEVLTTRWVRNATTGLMDYELIGRYRVAGTPTITFFEKTFPSGTVVANTVGVTVTAPTALSITPGTPPAAIVGQDYSYTPLVTGGLGTRHFTVNKPLPLGLALNPDTGQIYGRTGSQSVTGIIITGTDVSGTVASSSFSIIASIAAFDLDFINQTYLAGGVPTLLTSIPGYSYTGPAAGAATFTGSDGIIQRSNGNPRFVYDPVTLSPLGYLAEEARTNLAFPSNDFTNVQKETGNSVIANGLAGPFGPATMTKLVSSPAANGSQFHRLVWVGFGDASGGLKNVTVYARAAGYNYAFIQQIGAGSNGGISYFDLSNGNSLPGTATAAKSTFVGNGVYRIDVTFTATAAEYGIRIGLATNPNAPNGGSFSGITNQIVGDAASGVWFSQVDVTSGGFSTSPIITTNATVTRSADVMTVNGALIGAPFTLAASAILPAESGSDRYFAALSDGTGSNSTSLRRVSDNSLRFGDFVSASGGGASSAPTAGGPTRMSLRRRLNTITAYGNGSLIVSEGAYATRTTMNRLDIGHFLGASFANAPISKIVIGSSDVPDAVVQALP